MYTFIGVVDGLSFSTGAAISELRGVIGITSGFARPGLEPLTPHHSPAH